MPVDSFKFMARTLAESLKVWPYVDTSGEEIPWSPLAKPLGECVVALISSGGIYHREDVSFDMEREEREPLWGDPTFRELPQDVRQEDIRIAHFHYEHKHALEDCDCMMPVRALKKMLQAGRIGGIAERHLTFMGYQPRIGTFLRETLPAMIERLRRMSVDLVLISGG